MTRKDYELIADVIRRADILPTTDSKTLRLAAQMVAASLKNDNPRFDVERFMVAATGRP